MQPSQEPQAAAASTDRRARDRFPERAEREPGIVAHHFTQAGWPEAAIEWWGRAGSRAMHRFANHEAALSYVNGLNLMAELPASEKRDRRELAFRLALGPALLAARGYASNVRSNAITRRQAGSPRICPTRRAVFTSARGQWHYLYDRSEFDRALALAKRLCAIGTKELSTEKAASRSGPSARLS